MFSTDFGFDFGGGDINVDVGPGGVGVDVGNIPDITLPGGAVITTPDQISVGLGGSSPEDAAVIVVNRCEYLLRTNVSLYRAGQRSQSQALIVFDQVMQQLAQACGRVGGNWGRNCVGDREAGGKFDWVSAYRNPLLGLSPSGEIGGAGAGPLQAGFFNGISLSGLAVIALVAWLVWGKHS